LNNTDVDAGDTVSIPSAIGDFETNLSPIHGGPLDAFKADLGGVVGVVCVLMEEDNVTDDGAQAGHAALNNAVQSALDQIVATRSLSNQDVSDEEISQFTGQIQTAISNAIQAQQNFFENLWSWVNPDDSIGTRVFIFKHDDLAAGGTTNFSKRWQNEGDWELHGHITSSVLCPAGALDGLFSGSSAMMKMAPEGGQMEARQVIDVKNLARLREEKAPVARAAGGVFDLATLRQFRDGAYRQHPGLARWWALAERNLPSTIAALFQHAELREHAYRVMKELPRVVKNPGAPVPEALLEDVAKLAAGLKAGTRSRRLSIDASRVLSALPLVRGKTFQETAALLGSLEPARHPRMAGHPGLRIQPSARLRIGGTRIMKAADAAYELAEAHLAAAGEARSAES
ncbi:MAG TPA: hypothetical protein VFJ16_32590, partial [Longimicrobium sp.]|nr:hypothetical protein [Longimicrobium sp.]